MADENNNAQGQSTPNEGTETGTKTYTQEEVDALIQAESDKRVTQALKTQEKKNAAKVKEAEKLAQMNEQEKYEYQLEQREKAIAEKEKALSLAENKNEASKILAEKGLSLALVDFIVAEDAETMKHNIDVIDKAFKQSVNDEVKKRIGAATPKQNSVIDASAMTKEQFKKLSVSEMMSLKQSNPDIFNSFIS